MENWREKIEKAIFVSVLVALGVVAYAYAHPAVIPFLGSSDFEMTVFDVGQGDSIFVQTSDGKQMLIDGGPDDTVLAKLGAVMPFWDHDIDVVVLTHPHADHVSGLVSVLRQYHVGEVWYTGVTYPVDAYLTFVDELRARGIVTKIISEPADIVFGTSMVSVLYPFSLFGGGYIESPNNTSIVLKFTSGQHSVLTTGDIEVEAERELVASYEDMQIDVLKVAHHGSKTSSTEEFLDATQPGFAIIPVGENDYGHPNYEVVRRLENNGARVLRTDQGGDVLIRIFNEGLCIFQSSSILECE